MFGYVKIEDEFMAEVTKSLPTTQLDKVTNLGDYCSVTTPKSSLFAIGNCVPYQSLNAPEIYIYLHILTSAIENFRELMTIWRFSGTYIYVIVKMLQAMIPLLSLVLLPLVAFGTLREGIMVMSRTQITAERIKNIFPKPYFMLYGEVYAPEVKRE
ncbi:Transient receptor potential channel, partial [Taenia solium]